MQIYANIHLHLVYNNMKNAYIYIYEVCIFYSMYFIYIYIYVCYPPSSIYAFKLFGNIECQLADDQRDCGQCDKRDSSNDYASYSYSFGLLIDQMGYGQ